MPMDDDEKRQDMVDIYCIGEMVIDMIPGSEPGSYLRKAGGAPANVAITAAKNGLKARMACKVGNDEFGRFLMETLRQNGVGQAVPALCDEAVTTLAFVTLREDGERVFTFARKPGADMMLSEDEVKESDIDEAAIIHAGSCSLSAHPEREATEKALRMAHAKGKLVSFDVNYRNLMWEDDLTACTEAVMGVLPCVDMLKISEEEAGMLGGEASFQQLMEKNGLTMLVETLGSQGAKAFFGNQTIEVPGQRVKAVDATGAGDAFWGAFLSYLRFHQVTKTADISADLIRDGMNYGNVSGCLCVQSKGAISSIPTRQQIEAYLAGRKE